MYGICMVSYKYSGGLLNEKLSHANWGVEFGDVQSCWDYIEKALLTGSRLRERDKKNMEYYVGDYLIKIVDEIAPLK